ncbi:MAG: complex I subunit 4 family protein [Nocardioides sp.]
MSAVLLDGLVAVPFAFALLTWLVAGRERLALGLAVLGGLVTFGWSVWAAVASSTRLHPGVDVAWIRALDIRWHLGLDGISSPLVLMSTLVFACCLLSLVWRAPAGPSRGVLAALLLLIEAGVLGAFTALDMVLFFAFFEVALIPMWFVINLWGDAHDEPGRLRAATRFLIFTVLGSALMLVGFLLVHAGVGTFDITRVAATYDRTGPLAVGAALLVGLGLAVKTPVWPLHIWLPDAHAKAPTVGSVVLAAVLLKLGTYGLIRFWMPVTDPSWRLLVPFAAGLAVVGIVYAALACLVQTDLKRLIAYSSVGHMGFVVLAVATFTVAGVQAAVFASVAHGLVTGLLFFLAGAVKDRYGTGDLGRLSALYGRVPLLGGLVAFGAMASLGLPGLAGFWGEMLAIRSALYPAAGLPRTTYVVLAVIAALGVVLTVSYFLALVRRMLQGPRAAAVEHVDAAPSGLETLDQRLSVELTTEQVEPGFDTRPDVDEDEWLVWSPLLLLVVVLGLAPGLLLTPVGQAVPAFLGWLR